MPGKPSSSLTKGKPITYSSIVISISAQITREVTQVRIFSSLNDEWVQLDSTDKVARAQRPIFDKAIQIVAYPTSYMTQKLRMDVYDGDILVGSSESSIIDLVRQMQQHLPVVRDNGSVGTLQLSLKIDSSTQTVTIDNFGIDPTMPDLGDNELEQLFDDAYAEEVDLAMKTTGILKGISEKWSLNSNIVVDISDMCIRNLKEKFSKGGNTRYDDESVLRGSNIYESVKIVQKCTAAFAKNNSLQAFAGGGVKPPYGDHPAANSPRDGALPLAQELLLPKLMINESWCSFEGCRVFCGGEPIEEEDIFQFDSDGDEEDDGEGDEDVVQDKDDILTPPALPDITAVDADGRLRSNLLKSGNTGWGGRGYCAQFCFRNLMQLRQGVSEAAALYQPCLIGQGPSSHDEKTAKSQMARRRSSYYDVGSHTYGDDFDARFINMVKADELMNEYFNMDVEALSQLLITPKPKHVRIVTWILGRCPPLRVLNRAQDLMRFMAEKRGGRVALLIMLASESGLHTQTASGAREAIPFKEFCGIMKNVMRAPKRPTLPEEEDRKNVSMDPSTSRIRFWKQQTVESKVNALEVSYLAEVASPKLLLVHMLTWIEVMDRAILEEVADGSNSGDIYPRTASIMKQITQLLPKRVVRNIRGDLSKEQRPDRAELRSMQERFEKAMRSIIYRRVNAFVHEVYHSAVTAM